MNISPGALCRFDSCLHTQKRTACFCLLTGLNMVELVSLNMVKLASLNMVELASLNMVELASLNMIELASLNMVELASLNSVVDRLVHACWNSLFMA